mmetsp:Transcript_3877/g.7460  ORF Transcript_3877/g.7460 Transcript_3877/m.7460 type:complete len:139 (-) Transcript_3877:1096-1512(-)
MTHEAQGASERALWLFCTTCDYDDHQADDPEEAQRCENFCRGEGGMDQRAWFNAAAHFFPIKKCNGQVYVAFEVRKADNYPIAKLLLNEDVHDSDDPKLTSIVADVKSQAARSASRARQLDQKTFWKNLRGTRIITGS